MTLLHNHDRVLKTAIGCLLAWASPVAFACESNTPLETVYCQLKHDYASLPTLEDFRRNSPKIQRLLLKRPAMNAGIALPTKTASRSKPITQPVNPSARAPKLHKSEFLPSNPLPESRENKQTSDCGLSSRGIRCGNDIYQLALNETNSKLSVGSLSDGNQMQFLPYQHSSQSSYWSESYKLYIEKMLSIGLGASTMSYTKFVYTWQEAEKQGQDPKQRFSQMFEFLKRDKKTMGVKARYDNSLPESLSWCQPLSRQHWVCDNGKRNWVYTRLDKR